MNSLPDELVEAQLERILASAPFVARDKLCRFLRYVVEQKQTDRSGKIKQYTIAVDALGYGEQFDPSANPSIRILAQRLRRALEQYYAGPGASDPVRISIPKGSYVPAIGTNPTVEQNAESAPALSIHDSFKKQPQNALPFHPSIAVLPLEYLGQEPEHNYVASGLTEEIVVALTRFPEFLVVGPLDRERIRQARMDPRDIGGDYQVRFLFDGTVRLRGDSLRIVAKLTDTFSGQQLWARAFDYDFATSTVGQLEDEIVGQVVGQIADNFGVIPRALAKEVLSRHDESLSDYRAILLFHHHVRTVTEKSLAEAIAALEQVVQRDPNHDLALALLGDLVTGPYWLGYTDDRSDLERAAHLAQRALALNPNSQAAHVTMAIVCYLTDQNARCLTEIDAAMRLNPNNANYIANSALFLLGLGELDRGYRLIQKAMQLNPHHPCWYHYVSCLYHYYKGEYEPALVDAKAFNTPEYFWDPLIRTAVLGQLGHQAEAKKTASELLFLVPDFHDRGRSVIQRMVYQDEYVDMIWNGLMKAGLAVHV